MPARILSRIVYPNQLLRDLHDDRLPARLRMLVVGLKTRPLRGPIGHGDPAVLYAEVGEAVEADPMDGALASVVLRRWFAARRVRVVLAVALPGSLLADA